MKPVDMAKFSKSNFTEKIIIIICLIVIVFSIGSFTRTGIIRGLQAQEPDYFYFYTAGELWKQGSDLYDYNLFRSKLKEIAGSDLAEQNRTGYIYPPQTSVLFSIYALFPSTSALIAIMVLNLLLLLICFLLIIYILSWYVTVGLVEITLVIFMFLNSSFGRANVRTGHLGILMCFLLLSAFILEHKKKAFLGGVFLGFVSLKPTFLPQQILYFLFRRSLRIVIVCIVVGGIITIAPLVLTGRPIIESISGFLNMISQQSRPGDMNDVSPNVVGSALLMHLQPLINRILNSQSLITTLVTWIIIVFGFGYAAYLILNTSSQNKNDLLDFALFSGLSLISIYHRNYDIFLLFPGILSIYLYLLKKREIGQSMKFGGLVLAIILIMITLPGDLLVQLATTNPSLVDDYLWKIIEPFQIWASVLVVMWLFWIKRSQLTIIHKPGLDIVNSTSSDI